MPSHYFAAFSKWRSCPCSAALSRSLHGGGHGGVSHSVVRVKKKPVHQNQPRRRFRSAEASLMYRPCILQAPRGLLPICVIQLTHLHGSIVYHIEPMFVNRILVNFYKCHNSSVTRGSIPDFLDGTPFDFTTKLTEVYHVQLHLPYLFLNFVDDLSLKFRS